ncbi:glycoside hydrolase family 3 protein [Ligilactobacillus hohenheimensis]|uniref:glycoside hydrolase family 3 protein n=1 Tax=Ligilactobacillus hohenheimensis TaxID=2991832 RepID=UPI0024B9D82D|nr:glycoside hydrolase family 3 N-terminal domain-containing protein [Ligilactobacillus hohenheimensis]
MSVDLTAKPYYLNEEQIKWVKDTIAGMSLEEKIGQLFINMGSSREEGYLKGVLDNYHIGGVRYNPGTAEEVYDQNKILQENSKIPLLIAANTEAGGDGACTDGTYVGHEIKVAATRDEHLAYRMGQIAGEEAAAIGCNWSFAPIVGLLKNWRNPILSVRTWSDDPDLNIKLSLAYMKGIQEFGIAPAAKHFPGDGSDERDQHLSFAPNHSTVEEWDNSFGKVFQALIDAGVPSIMAGHIGLPSYVRYFKPDATLQEANLPATLNKYLITDLLRKKMGFNGVIVTDASHMVGMTGTMKRRDLLTTAIAAGVDLFLFFNDPDEDFQWMMDGYKNGVITDERLNDALMHILGLKAHIGLNKGFKFLEHSKEEQLAHIGKPENKKVAHEVTDKAITLVKNKEHIFPISPAKQKRVLLVDVKGHEGGFGMIMGGSSKRPVDVMKELLEKEGFTVTIWQSLEDQVKDLPPEKRRAAVANVYAQKRPISELTDNYDLIINMAKVVPNTDQRIQWPASKGTPDIPFYIHEVPTIFVSVNSPFHLADVPQVQTYINCYDDQQDTLEALVDKMLGRSEFKGQSPVDAFCGFEDTRY